MSIVALENPVSRTAWRPKPISITRSAGGFEAMNDRAAETAFSNAAPFIERERSIRSAMLLARPRFSAAKPTTGSPFSSTAGAFEDGVGVTTE